MDFLKIKLVDNTVKRDLTHVSYEKGVSEYERHYIPNEGVTEDGDVLHFHPYNLIHIDGDAHVIFRDNVFLKNGYLQKPGVIVEKRFVELNESGFILGDQKFFRVVISSVEEVEAGCLIIIMANQCARFNYAEREYFFVGKENIFLCISDSIRPGPDYVLLELLIPDSMGANPDKSNFGVLAGTGTTYYFDQAQYELDIYGVRHVAVRIRDLKLRLASDWDSHGTSD